MTESRLRSGLVLTFLFSLALPALCQNGPPPARLIVSPANPMLIMGGTTSQQFTVTTGFFSSLGQTPGHSSSLTTTNWSSSNGSVATINSSGLATLAGPGTTTITARKGGFFGATQLIVGSTALKSIAVTPATKTIAQGLKTQLTATATFTDNSTAVVTNAATWTSGDTTKVQMLQPFGNRGLASGVLQSSGAIAVTAAIGAVQGAAGITVGPPALVSINVTAPSSNPIQQGVPVQLTATGIWTTGMQTPLTQLPTTTWGSSDTSTATVTSVTTTPNCPTNAPPNNCGEVTGLKPGNVNITATDTPSGISGQLQVSVSALNPQITPTATQAVFNYSAPTSAACTLVVSENASLTPLVHAVDPALFPGSNSDGGTAPGPRVFVVGRKGVASATDSNNYSLALQAFTTHSYQLSCGNQTASGTFQTMNIPLGKTFGENFPVGSTGSYMYPTLPETRNFTVVDPLTGALVRRLSTSNDTLLSGGAGWGPTGWYDAGAFKACAYQKLADGGYYCVVPGHQGIARWFWVNPVDGTNHFLGVMQMTPGTDYQFAYPQAEAGFDTTDPSSYYTIGTSSTSTPIPCGSAGQSCIKPVILKWTYNGTNTADAKTDAVAPFKGVNLTPVAGNHTLTDLIVAFDPTYIPVEYGGSSIPSNPTKQSIAGGCQIHAVQLNYMIIGCRRAQQDSPAWEIIIDLGDRLPIGQCSNCLHVVAAMPMWANPSTRWCGQHSNYFMGDTSQTYLVPQTLKTSGGTGPWEVTLDTAVTSGATSLTITGAPTTEAPQASGTGIPPDGVNFLMNTAAGDTFEFEDNAEWVHITAISGTPPKQWTVQRASSSAGGPAAAHAAGTKLRAQCPAKPDIWWDFVADPHGTDASNTKYIVEQVMFGGHRVSRPPYDIMAPNNVRIGSFPGQFNTAISFVVDTSPPFSGLSVQADGNTYQKHPAYDQVNAPASEKAWWLDIYPYQFTGNPDTATLVSGTLYKYHFVNHTLDPVTVPYFGISGITLLKDISGPGSSISDQPVDNNKYCVAKNAGECRSGSAAGDVYINAPNVTLIGCQAGEQFDPSKIDICVNNTATYGQALAQFGLVPTNITKTQNGITFYGAGASRVLVRGLIGPYRIISNFSNAHPLPDGSWSIFASRVPGTIDQTTDETYLVKMPPTPTPDGIDRSNFINVPVQTTTVTNATTAKILYGYEENGPRTSFFCTQRAEPCSLSTVPGASINIPAVTQRVVFYQIQYLNSSNVILQTSPLQAAAVP